MKTPGTLIRTSLKRVITLPFNMSINIEILPESKISFNSELLEDSCDDIFIKITPDYRQ
ncbi:MAG: hypothetical protein PWP03_78 [Candidatus Woesearchaeota archaeon]|nr:hypothetical protein [Candidatus Woesearchaeota archaeon]MDN5327440.1 hypothetical protein [Candidatus Woesearchaeota archaeon]